MRTGAHALDRAGSVPLPAGSPELLRLARPHRVPRGAPPLRPSPRPGLEGAAPPHPDHCAACSSSSRHEARHDVGGSKRYSGPASRRAGVRPRPGTLARTARRRSSQVYAGQRGTRSSAPGAVRVGTAHRPKMSAIGVCECATVRRVSRNRWRAGSVGVARASLSPDRFPVPASNPTHARGFRTDRMRRFGAKEAGEGGSGSGRNGCDEPAGRKIARCQRGGASEPKRTKKGPCQIGRAPFAHGGPLRSRAAAPRERASGPCAGAAPLPWSSPSSPRWASRRSACGACP